MFMVDIALTALALTLLVVIARVGFGPTDADRVAAVDLGFIVFVAATALLSVRMAAPALLDLVLVAVLIGFLATVALARWVERKPS